MDEMHFDNISEISGYMGTMKSASNSTNMEHAGSHTELLLL